MKYRKNKTWLLLFKSCGIGVGIVKKSTLKNQRDDYDSKQ